MDTPFHPYRVIRHDQENLELSITGARQLALVITWRFLPIFILTMLGFLAFSRNQQGEFPFEMKFGLGFIGLVACALFLVKIIVRVNITGQFFEIISYRFLFSQSKKYAIVDIQFIQALFSDRVRGGAIFYTIKLKNGKSVEFMRQPTFSSTKEDMKVVCAALGQVTRLEVKLIDGL